MVEHMGQGTEQRFPWIGDKAPSFRARTTQGDITFPDDYRGKWVILFSHPADFTPVCTTEFMALAAIEEELKRLNCALIGLSVDSHYSHIAWLRTIKERIKYRGMEHVDVRFPVIADVRMEVARKFGMVQPSASDTQAVRAVFYLDPQAIIRAVLFYPMSNGRNVEELKRLLLAMQLTDKHAVSTPADWHPGDKVIVPPPGSCGQAVERVEASEKDYECLDWFLCLKDEPL